MKARGYRMSARAERTRQTGRRIVAALRELVFDRGLYYDDVTLREVAERAGVTEQTVIRRFHSKEGLFDALVDELSPEIESARGLAPVGDVQAAVRIIVDEYERMGDGVVRALAQEERFVPIARAVAVGRASHRRWCERTFAPYLPPSKDRNHRRRLALFIAALDVYTWKLLRRDAGLGRAQTERAMRELVEALVQQHRQENEDG